MNTPETQSPALIGWFFLTGAVVVTVAMLQPDVRADTPLPWVVMAVVAGAYTIGTGCVVRRNQPMRVATAFTLVALGTVSVTVIVATGPPALAAAWGGMYAYVAAYAFLFFSRRLAAVQSAGIAVGFAVAVHLNGAVAHPFTEWLTVTVVVLAGAGIVGLVGAGYRARRAAEHEAVIRQAELATLRATFLQAVSHELRTPLTSVHGFASTLEDHGEQLAPEVRQRIHRSMREQTERLGQLLDDLLDVDRLQRGDATARREVTELARIVGHALGQVDDDRHQVIVGTLPGVPVQVEAALVERMLVNLLANAIRHTPAGTRVTVTAAIDDDRQLVIDVCDDGPGVPAELHTSLFDPFVQGSDAGDRAQPGTGIGLALVRQMARMHGGHARVGDSKSGGACFRVVLPEAGPAELPTPEPEASGRLTGAHRGR